MLVSVAPFQRRLSPFVVRSICKEEGARGAGWRTCIGGTIAGYAEEITDDIPEGLEYLPDHETNKKYEWVMIDKEGKETEDVKEAVKVITKYLSKENY